MSVTKFLTGFAVGAAIGAIAGILLAPKSGAETREMLGAPVRLFYDSGRKGVGLLHAL